MTVTHDAQAAAFLALHHERSPLLLPNPWDIGTAKILVSLGFEALATTSSGFAATLGRTDGSVTRDEAIAHGAALAAEAGVPVSADLENGFADEPEAVAETVRRAVEAGLAGCSIEDYAPAGLYDRGLARERIAAASDAAHRGPRTLVLTARAENYLRGNPDLDDTIARLQAFQEAGADVLYPTGVAEPEAIASIIAAVDRPINVIARPGLPSINELGALGVSRVSIGGSFAWVAADALVQAATELREQGTYGFFERAARGAKTARAAFKA